MKHDDGMAAEPRVAYASPAAGVRLRPYDVDLWRVSLDEQPEEGMLQLRASLSADEEQRAASFYFERDRRRFVVGRGILRILIARYTGADPEDVAFRYGANGKPSLAGRTAEPLHFNLAHSEGVALYAFTRTGEVGVDLERIRDMADWEFIAASCFPAPDQKRVLAAGSEQRLAEFFRAWTRQEARLKATGAGLGDASYARRLRVSPTKPEGHAAPYVDGDNPAFVGVRRRAWRTYPLEVVKGFAAALAAPDSARWVTCFSWDQLQLLGRSRAPRRTRRVALGQAAEAGIGPL